MSPGDLARERMIQFVARLPGKSAVSLAADFTSWQPRPLSKRPDGCFELSLPVPPGLRAYKYLVDGQWCEDPACPDRRPDGYGGYNSVRLVGAPGLEIGGPGEIRVASLNLHTYQEREPLEKLAEVARVFAALDIHAAALQEVGQHRDRPDLHPNAGEVVRSLLEAQTCVPWQHVWRSAHVGFDVYDEGISLLSRIPLEDIQEHELGGKTYRRIALSARLSLEDIRLCSVHTSWASDGGIEEIDRLVAALGRAPVLLAGDLNAGPREEMLRRLAAAGLLDVGAALGVTSPTFLGGPLERIDYQLLRPGELPLRARALLPLFGGGSLLGVQQPRVSDHVGLLGCYAPRA